MGMSVVKIVFSIIALLLSILNLVLIIVSLSIYWYFYKVSDRGPGVSNTMVTFNWRGWTQDDDEHDWDVSSDYRLFALYMTELVSGVINGIFSIILIGESGVMVFWAFRGTFNRHKTVFTGLGTAITLLVGLIVNALVFIAHPAALKGDVDANENDENDTYRLVNCSLGNTDLDICSDFTGSQDLGALGTMSFGPGPGWIISVLVIPFDIALIVIFIVLSWGNELCCG